ncbi:MULTISPECIES: hypothetical protein [Providencia]|uniref:hypothetical protein n=1 Tax=Providencia TaxID=586 RepID=UPI00234B66E6|nr:MULTISPECIES: hypothetical protein [unclassified Providencia]
MSLVIIILLIILVPAILFLCLLKKRKWKFWLDESSLHVQPLFWFLVFLPLIISGIAWVLVAQDYELDVSTRGYSRLMDNAKFPFLILALSPILGAFVTSAHRSLQTELQIKTAKEQLDEAQKKNKVDIYFSRRKYIIERLAGVRSEYLSSDFNSNYIYELAYNFNDYTDEVNDSFYKNLNLRLEYIRGMVGRIRYDLDKIDNNEDYINAIESASIYRTKQLVNMMCDLFGYIGSNLNKNNEFENKVNMIHSFYPKKGKVFNSNDFSTFLSVYTAEVMFELEKIKSVIKEICVILLLRNDIQDMIPELGNDYISHGDTVYCSIFTPSNGDILAAENQNPPE